MLTGNRVVEPAGKILGGSGTQNFDFAHIWPLVPPGDPSEPCLQLYFIEHMPFYNMRGWLKIRLSRGGIKESKWTILQNFKTCKTALWHHHMMTEFWVNTRILKNGIYAIKYNCEKSLLGSPGGTRGQIWAKSNFWFQLHFWSIFFRRWVKNSWLIQFWI